MVELAGELVVGASFELPGFPPLSGVEAFARVLELPVARATVERRVRLSVPSISMPFEAALELALSDIRERDGSARLGERLRPHGVHRRDELQHADLGLVGVDVRRMLGLRDDVGGGTPLRYQLSDPLVETVQRLIPSAVAHPGRDLGEQRVEGGYHLSDPIH